MGLKMLLFSMVYGLLKGRNMKHPGMVFGVPNSETQLAGERIHKKKFTMVPEAAIYDQLFLLITPP